jgi:antitoxin VapB
MPSAARNGGDVSQNGARKESGRSCRRLPGGIYHVDICGEEVMAFTRLFRSNRTQAVRLSKAVAFPEGVEQVEVLVVGEARVIVPRSRRWATFFADGPFADADFMSDRAQPGEQRREAL